MDTTEKLQQQVSKNDQQIGANLYEINIRRLFMSYDYHRIFTHEEILKVINEAHQLTEYEIGYEASKEAKT